MRSDVDERIRVPVDPCAADKRERATREPVRQPRERDAERQAMPWRVDEPVDDDDCGHQLVDDEVDPRNRRLQLLLRPARRSANTTPVISRYSVRPVRAASKRRVRDALRGRAPQATGSRPRGCSAGRMFDCIVKQLKKLPGRTPTAVQHGELVRHRGDGRRSRTRAARGGAEARRCPRSQARANDTAAPGGRRGPLSGSRRWGLTSQPDAKCALCGRASGL